MTTTSRLLRLLVAAALAVGGVVVPQPAALAHAELQVEEVPTDTEVRLVIESIPERRPFRNRKFTTIIPRQFDLISCDAPDNWVCYVDRNSYAPHQMMIWETRNTPVREDDDFGLTVRTPSSAGAWLFRSIQYHDDGYVEPWVYESEPFPAPALFVGGGRALQNPDRSAEDPRCYGPSQQPASYQAHDGSEVEEGCDPNAPHPEPTSSPSSPPTPTPTPTRDEGGDPSPSASPSASTTPSPSSSPRPSPSSSTSRPTATPTPTGSGPSARPSATGSSEPADEDGTESSATDTDGSATESPSATEDPTDPASGGSSDPGGETPTPSTDPGPGDELQVDRDDAIAANLDSPTAARERRETLLSVQLVALLFGVSLLAFGMVRRHRRRD